MIIEKNTMKMFIVLSCLIYTIISKYFCIDYLGYEKAKLSDLRLGVSGRYKNIDRNYDNVLGFGIPDLLLNLFSCQGLSKNNESVVRLKCPHRMFEYYFNKVFIIFDCDKENLKRLPSHVKDRVGAEVTIISDKGMLCYTTIPSTSNTLKNLLVNSNYHSSYTNQEFNDKKEQIITIFSTYVTPQIKEIHHPEFLQEW